MTVHKSDFWNVGGRPMFGIPDASVRSPYLARGERFSTASPYSVSYGDAHNQPPPMRATPSKPSGYPDRSAIDALLCEDARCEPEFASARRAAVLEACDRAERENPFSPSTSQIGAVYVLTRCREYEDLRGGGRFPSEASQEYLRRLAGTYAFHGLLAYESHRGR